MVSVVILGFEREEQWERHACFSACLLRRCTSCSKARNIREQRDMNIKFHKSDFSPSPFLLLPSPRASAFFLAQERFSTLKLLQEGVSIAPAKTTPKQNISNSQIYGKKRIAAFWTFLSLKSLYASGASSIDTILSNTKLGFALPLWINAIN